MQTLQKWRESRYGEWWIAFDPLDGWQIFNGGQVSVTRHANYCRVFSKWILDYKPSRVSQQQSYNIIYNTHTLRYDVRNRFDDKSQFGLKSNLPQRFTEEEEELEELLDQERYLAMGTDITEEELQRGAHTQTYTHKHRERERERYTTQRDVHTHAYITIYLGKI